MKETFFNIQKKLYILLFSSIWQGAFNHVDGKIIEVENRLNRIYNSMQNRLITSTELATRYRDFMNDIVTLNNFEIIPAGQCGFNVLCLIDGFVDCFLYPSKGTKR